MKNPIAIFNIGAIKRLLWSNASSKQTIAKNAFWLGALEISINIIKFGLLVYATQVLGDVGFGLFSFVSSFVTIFGILFELGLSEAIVREFAKGNIDDEQIGSLLSLKLLISAVVGFALFIASYFVSVNGPESIQLPIVILGGYIFLASLSGFFYAFFRARQRMELEFLPTLIQNLLIAASGFLFLTIVPKISSLTWAYFLGAAISLIPVVWYFNKHIAKLTLKYDIVIWKRFMRIAYPLAIVAIVSSAIYINIDSLLLGFFGLFEQNGWYNAAYRIVTFTLLPMVFISQSFFPAFAAGLQESKERLQRLVSIEQRLLMVIGIPLLFGGYAVAPKLIEALYPAEFAPAVTVFRLLLVVGLIFYLYMPLKQVLIVCNHQKKAAIIFFIAMIFNIGLGLVVVPIQGFVGAAIVAIVVHSIVLLGLSLVIIRDIGIHILERETLYTIILSLVSAAGMYSALGWMEDFSGIVVLIVAGIVVYTTLFFGLCKLFKRPLFFQ